MAKESFSDRFKSALEKKNARNMRVVALASLTLLATGCSSGSQSGSKAEVTFSNASEYLISASELPFDATLRDEVATAYMSDSEQIFLEPDLDTIDECNQLSEISDEIKINASWKVERALTSLPKDHADGFNRSDVLIHESIYKFDGIESVTKIVNLAREGLTNPACFVKAKPDSFAVNIVSGDGSKEIGKFGDKTVFVRQTSVTSAQIPHHEDLDFSYCSVLVANEDQLIRVRVGVDSHGLDDESVYSVIKNSLAKIFNKQ